MTTRLWPVTRRTFLRGAGVALGLPFMEAMRPRAAARAADKAAPMRLVCLGNPLGMLPDGFFPFSTGAGYKLPEVLQPLEQHRKVSRSSRILIMVLAVVTAPFMRCLPV